ncbi:C69 family dipeptidase [Bifidobacterium gallicum]|uniref:Dipeptidase n=1 Tax=Bifidobacterium gallicum DSM 20093 = LMG 11596 TaxID=561180 RepID=D1NVU5_9BIFI|nr:C69 family dipeptidase [Bifidobacterium gallicum]EFA22231.1 dipeptidase [Bifidobacterium gallicum DSM 20093 = LMG 11596]KFI57066.1 peptidase C69 [Bifidobacterium gallicum DSM 20093 = LMG 11596]
MSCTTLLVGKAASYDGSTIIARNEDSGSGEFDAKNFVVIKPEDQPRTYTSVNGHLTIELPDNPLQYTAMPNADKSNGVWGEAGINEANVAMTATETITTNARVLGADPFVEYVPAKDGQEAIPGGIGEEDLVTIVLPYIKTAREGVLRLGKLLEEYGTYEMNGIGFSDADEIWWLETVGGHHWIAKRVPDEAYVTMPNQLGIDEFDLDDAFGDQEEHLCSADLIEFIRDNHLDIAVESVSVFNPRMAFGSHSDSDHVYNTPRAWYMQRYFNPYDSVWDGPDAEVTPTSDDIPWCRQPDRKITIEDVKYILSSHYQETPYDPFGRRGTEESRGMFRQIGINRTNELSVMQIRPYRPQSNRAIQWVAFGDGAFNALLPMFTNVDTTPEYVSNATTTASTDNLYWADRIIAALCDPNFATTKQAVAGYDEKLGGIGHHLIAVADSQVDELDDVDTAALRETDIEEDGISPDIQPMHPDDIVKATRNSKIRAALAQINATMAAHAKEETDKLLGTALYTASMNMKDAFSMSDF